MKKKNYKVTIVVPVLNEEENILPFLRKFYDFKKKSKHLKDYEILFIDDGSTDNTLKKIKSLKLKNKKIKIISFTKNFGVNFAFSAGVDHVKSDFMIFIDADSQYPIKVIDDFIKKWKLNNKIIFAKRIDYKEKMILRFMGFIFIKVFNKISKTKLDFNTSYTCLLDISIVHILKNLREKSKYYPALIRWLGYEISYVNCKMNKRSIGKSKIGMIQKLKEATSAITNFTTSPLKILTLVGIGISTIAMFSGLYILFGALTKGISVPGYPSIFLSILFMGGLQLISIGIVSEYIAKIYDEGKKRPEYLINEKIGF